MQIYTSKFLCFLRKDEGVVSESVESVFFLTTLALRKVQKREHAFVHAPVKDCSFISCLLHHQNI